MLPLLPVHRSNRIQPALPGLQAAQCLLQGFLEGAPNRHRLPDRLHLGGQERLGLREFLEREARNLGHDVIQGRLERAWRRAVRDVVAEFVQRVANGQAGRHLGDRKAGGLGGKRRGARDARIHLDNHQPPVVRMDRELHVGASGVHADLAQHRDGSIAHPLVFLVRQGLRRRHRDRVPGVHPHRIEVLDRADDDAVVVGVAHHLHLELLPAQKRFLQQNLMGRRQVQAMCDDVPQFFLVPGYASPGSAQGERRPHDHGITDLGLEIQRLLHAAHHLGPCLLQPDLPHGLAEQLPVLGHGDGLQRRADQFHPVSLQHPFAVQVQRAVQRGLPAHGRQQHVRFFTLDDARQGLPFDRLDVDGLGHLRVGHDGGGVGVDQDDAVALLSQRLAGLRPGVVELASLADHDRPGPDHEDAFDVGPLRHGAQPDCPARCCCIRSVK